MKEHLLMGYDETLNKINVCIDYIKKFFEETNGKVAVIGISGGKDSTVAAALCGQALGKENVIGVMMPLGTQKDIEDSKRVCEFLGIGGYTVNIERPFNALVSMIASAHIPEFNTKGPSQQTIINLAPRLRMSTLYAIAQTVNGRVINTTNACERFVGYGTLFGDTVGDLALLKNLTVSEIYEIGDALGLPYDLVHKTPADGLTGKSDEDVLGVSYEDIEKYLIAERKSYLLKDEGYAFYQMKDEMNIDTFEKINELTYKSEFKRQIINVPGPEFN